MDLCRDSRPAVRLGDRGTAYFPSTLFPVAGNQGRVQGWGGVSRLSLTHGGAHQLRRPWSFIGHARRISYGVRPLILVVRRIRSPFPESTRICQAAHTGKTSRAGISVVPHQKGSGFPVRRELRMTLPCPSKAMKISHFDKNGNPELPRTVFWPGQRRG